MRYAVIGAGGHSREVADLIAACGSSVAGFVDEILEGPHRPTGLPVCKNLQDITHDAVAIAVGDPHTRRELSKRYAGEVLPALVHPSACVSDYATIGAGVQVMQNVVVSSSAVVGDNVILNVGCFVAHDCTVGAHSHVAPGVLMSGGSSCGDRCTLGAGAILLPGVQVGSDCTIGAGAVVRDSVPDGQTVVGVPARAIGGR